MLFTFTPDARAAKLERRILDLEANIEAKDRQLSVAQAEIESLAGVIARDRERIKAKGAAYARQRAESEGVSNERSDQGIR